MRFFVLEYCKRYFSGLYCLKKKVGIMAMFGPKPWVNLFGKMSIFLLFELFCFYSLERRFFVLEYCKRYFISSHFLGKKEGENLALRDQELCVAAHLFA